MGVKGACPLGLPPPLGERGGHPRNFHASSKNSRGFPMKINYSVMIRDFYSQFSIYDDSRRPRRVAPAADQ